MSKRWSGVYVLVLMLSAYGCDTANGGPIGTGGVGGTGGTGGVGGTGGTGGTGGVGGTGGTGGVGGTGGTGGTVDLCLGVDCSDANDCTDDVCNPADGSCSNPNKTDGVACDFGGLPGVCMSGTCQDAMLCAGVDCSDANDCTDDVCNPADGSCSNPNKTDGAACDFGGLPGVCMAGTCEDAMLCAGVDCSDGNDCTDDVCNPADGSCSNPNEPDGTKCDASGLPGACQAGVCVASCTPTAGVAVTLPTLSVGECTILGPTYTDVANGFVIRAPIGQVTTSPQGIGANANRSCSGFEENDRLIIEFFDASGGLSTASGVSILLDPAGVAGTVVITVDNGAPGAPVAVTPGGSIDILQSGAHKIEVAVPDLDPVRVYWEELTFDHDCL